MMSGKDSVIILINDCPGQGILIPSEVHLFLETQLSFQVGNGTGTQLMGYLKGTDG